MKIIRAAEMGMCFGVRDALQIMEQVSDPTQVSIHGQLVHNPIVSRRLSEAGFGQLPEDQRDTIPSAPLVLITAHGVSDKEADRLQASGKQLIDTTCPLVRRVHEAANRMAADGRYVLLIGKPGHVEVRGIVEDLADCQVISSPQDVRAYAPKRLGIVCQTTMPISLVAQIKACIADRNPTADIQFVDTVCHPTKRRQQAMLELIDRVDAVVVVGGRNSNNTQRLAELCRQHNVPALHVTCADEVNPDWFGDANTIGLTAGTSTLDETIDEVHERLEQIANRNRARTT